MEAHKPNFQRLLTTIYRQEPDQVPLVELTIDNIIKQQFLRRPVIDIQDEVAFWAAAGYDYVYLRPNYEFLGTPPAAAVGTPIAWEASAVEKDVASMKMVQAGPVATLVDLETYPWPDPQTVDFSILETASGLLPGGMGIISGVGGIFTRTWSILGFERFCYSLFDDPELMARVFGQVGHIQCEVMRRVVKLPKVFAIWYGDDLAYAEGLMVSPRFYRQYLFPWMEELASIAHASGLPFIFHSDGVLWAILDDLIALGVDALHPIEPKAMDINEVKRRYGDQLALFGNIDLSYTLTRGTPEEVRTEVRQRILDLAPGGGYGVGSANSVTRYVPLANFNAMREATLEYGVYPIHV